MAEQTAAQGDTAALWDALKALEAQRKEETKALRAEVAELQAQLRAFHDCRGDAGAECQPRHEEGKEEAVKDKVAAPRTELLASHETPNPDEAYPVPSVGGIRRTVFLKNIIKNPSIIVGDYTYYDDPENLGNFEKNVMYLFDHMKDRLVIGKFCQIACGVRFLMNAANHALSGFSTYPFPAFGGTWAGAALHVASKGDTVVGNDVWLGNNATVMPGIRIGDGAVVGTNALVTKDVAPYTIVGGNPAKVIRKRFSEDVINTLLRAAWWDWPIDKITANVQVLLSGDLKALKALMQE